MTVAAIILTSSTDEALAPLEGRPLARRLVDAAWSGGAVPVIVVVADPGGAVAATLAGAPATLVAPAADPAASVRAAVDAALAEVAETDAALLWPAAYAWVDPETLGSQIEAHGTDPDAILRPAFDGAPGWPALVPLARLGPPGADPLALLASARLLDLGDPGTVHDRLTARAALPPYRGPLAPTSGQAHEWGSMAAEDPDFAADEQRAPLEGPAAAPFGQASEPE